MAFLINLPLELRLACLFVVGALVGGQINRAIYRLGWNQRDIGPWSKADPRLPPRRWLDYVPIVGWFGLRRESSVHGGAFWLRPMLIEFCFAFFLAWLYYWITGQAGLIPIPPGKPTGAEWMLHLQWLSLICLFVALIVATFIDFDEQNIPDEITVPGTIMGLLLAALWPASGLPVVLAKTVGPGLNIAQIGEGVERLLLISPWPRQMWPAWLNGPWGLAIGVACFLGWCLALLPILWYPRHGFGNAFRYLAAHIIQPPRKSKGAVDVEPRRPAWMMIAVLALMVAGPLGIAAIWMQGGLKWMSLLSALVGLVFGGGLIWAVRIVGTYALKKEAMGFGDVTLMAMIGSFVGWQPSLIIFFLAPLAAVIIATLQVLLTRKHEIAFGPYLSLGTVILILGWAGIWNGWAVEIFIMGWLIPEMVVLCLVLMAVMLLAWRLVKERVLGIEDEDYDGGDEN